jgi:hypothetical protein
VLLQLLKLGLPGFLVPGMLYVICH